MKIVMTCNIPCTAGAVCEEEMTNNLTWPATIIGSNSSQFCLQNESESYTHFLLQ